MKTLDQINEDIRRIVQERMDRCREGGVFNLTDPENALGLERDMQKSFVEAEVNVRFGVLYAIAETLDEYLKMNSIDGRPERQPLRKKMKEMLESL